MLKGAGVSIGDARREVEKIIGRNSDVTLPIGEIPFTAFGKRVLLHAWNASQRLRHRLIDTEHLLIGLTQVKDGVAYRVLVNLEVDLEQLRQYHLSRA